MRITEINLEVIDPIQAKLLDDFSEVKTSLAQLSTWQDYALRQLCIQQISIPLIAKNNV